MPVFRKARVALGATLPVGRLQPPWIMRKWHIGSIGNELDIDALAEMIHHKGVVFLMRQDAKLLPHPVIDRSPLGQRSTRRRLQEELPDLTQERAILAAVAGDAAISVSGRREDREDQRHAARAPMVAHVRAELVYYPRSETSAPAGGGGGPPR